MSSIALLLERRIQDKLKALSEDVKQKALKKGLDKMDEIKNKKSKSGRSPAKNGDWDNSYVESYAKKMKGGSRSPVDLRNSRRGIENTSIKPSGKGKAKLVFIGQSESGTGASRTLIDTAKVMAHHQKASNKDRRQIYPENQAELPDEVRDAIFNELRKAWREA